jgi:two-component system response regulator MprA
VQQLRFSDLTLDPATLTAVRGDLRIDLTRTEFALLHLFMRNPNKILSKQQIFEDVWGYDFGTTSNSHEIYVGYLRRKTEAGGGDRLIHTVRGSGYVMRDQDDSDWTG